MMLVCMVIIIKVYIYYHKSSANMRGEVNILG